MNWLQDYVLCWWLVLANHANWVQEHVFGWLFTRELWHNDEGLDTRMSSRSCSGTSLLQHYDVSEIQCMIAIFVVDRVTADNSFGVKVRSLTLECCPECWHRRLSIMLRSWTHGIRMPTMMVGPPVKTLGCQRLCVESIVLLYKSEHAYQTTQSSFGKDLQHNDVERDMVVSLIWWTQDCSTRTWSEKWRFHDENEFSRGDAAQWCTERQGTLAVTCSRQSTKFDCFSTDHPNPSSYRLLQNTLTSLFHTEDKQPDSKDWQI